MVKALVAASLFCVAQADTLAVTWSDCGDADTHAKVTDLSPSTIETGATSPLVGTGTLDEDVNGATFSAVVKAGGVKLASCDGDASQDVDCKLPLGVGKITLKAMSFPITAGQIPVNTEISLSSVIPASMAKTQTHVEAVSDTSDKLVCLDVMTAKQELKATGENLAVTWSDCGDADTHAKVTDLSPSSIVTGGTSPLVGTGTLDEDVNGATFSATVKAGGVKLASCDGDASQDVACKLPLGVGTITIKALSFPLSAGQIPVNTEITLSSVIPASMAKTQTHIEAVSDTSDKLVCLDVQTAKQEEIVV